MDLMAKTKQEHVDLWHNKQKEMRDIQEIHLDSSAHQTLLMVIFQ